MGGHAGGNDLAGVCYREIRHRDGRGDGLYSLLHMTQGEGLAISGKKRLVGRLLGELPAPRMELERNSLHLALPAQPGGKQSRLVQDGITALFPKRDGARNRLFQP